MLVLFGNVAVAVAIAVLVRHKAELWML